MEKGHTPKVSIIVPVYNVITCLILTMRSLYFYENGFNLFLY